MTETQLVDERNELGMKRAALFAPQTDLVTLEGALANERVRLVGLRTARAATMRALRPLQRTLSLLMARRAALMARLELLQQAVVRRQAEITTIEVECEPGPIRLTTSLTGGAATGGKITVPHGTAVSDSAKLTGPFATIATGTVSYSVYSDKSCTKLTTTGGTVIVTGRAVPTSNAEMLTPGTYFWQASYGGDRANLPAKSVCGTEVETVSP